MQNLNKNIEFNGPESARDVDAAQLVLLGTAGGDVIGSCYEFHATKDYNFRLFTARSTFTDDTVCTVAVADALTRGVPFDACVRDWCRRYPHRGYGGMFRTWIYTGSMGPYRSWGNGSAMRVSAVGAYARSLDEAMELAKKTAEITHNHREGVKGAQATAVAIYLALTGHTKDEIKKTVTDLFGYDLDRKYDDIKKQYKFDVSCQGTVPEAIISFLESGDYESAVRKAVALGGDADTVAAITGGLAAAYYGEIPDGILSEVLVRLPDEMKTAIERFNATLQ